MSPSTSQSPFGSAMLTYPLESKPGLTLDPSLLVQPGNRNEPTVTVDQSCLLEQNCPSRRMPDLSLMGTNPLVQKKTKFKEAKSARGHVSPEMGTNTGEWVTPGTVSAGWLPLKH